MDYRQELALRLGTVPFTAAAIAREAGLSREWVSKARRGKAPKLTLECARQIHEAVDRLVAQANSEAAPAPNHPGVTELLASPAMRQAHHVTTDEIRRLAALRVYDEENVYVIPDAGGAVAVLQALRSLRREPGDKPAAPASDSG